MYIYEGATTTGTYVYSLLGSAGAKDEEVCFSPGLHTIQMKDTYGDGWSTGSFLYLYVGGVSLGAFRIVNTREGTQQVSFPVMISTGDGWKYTSTAQTGTEWTTQAVSWEEMTSFPAVTTITRYFRKTVTNSAITSAFHTILNIATNAGFVCYINGQVAYSWNMPDTYTASTPALSSTEEAVVRTLSTLTGVYTTSSTIELAVEMHATADTTSGEEPFDISILLMSTNNVRRIDSDGSFTSIPATTGSEGSSMIYDNNVLTKWCVPATSVTTEWIFNNGRRELINRYSITTANDMPNRDPKSWILYGSFDGVTYYPLDQQTGVTWSRRYETQSFLINNYITFNRYKLVVSENSGNLSDTQFSEFELSISNQPVVPISLSYPQSSYEFSKGVDHVDIKPVLVGFTGFTIAGTLPAGLSFDSNSGRIYGLPNAGMAATTYTITATYLGNNQQYTSTLSLTVIACEFPDSVFLSMVKTNPSAEETFQIINYNNQVVFSGGYSTEGVFSAIQCVDLGVYTVKMLNSAGMPWATNSKLTLKTIIDGKEFVFSKSTLQENSEATFQLGLTYPLMQVYANSNVKYLMGSVPDNWYTTSFDASSWTTLTETSRPTSSEKIQLYRSTFTVSSVTGFHGFELAVKAQAGIVVYLNGQEIYRRYLPAGAISSSTSATGGQDSAYWRTITGKMASLVQGQNTLAVGIINVSTYDTPVAFDAILRLMTESVEYPRYWDFTSTSGSGDVSNLFDLDANTRARGAFNGGVDIVITLSNSRAEMFNEYCIVTNYDTPSEDPREWSIFGSNDNNNFDLIKSETNVFFDGRSTPYCFYMPGITKAYAIYKISITKVAEDSANYFAMSQFNFYLEDLDHAEVPELAFTPSNLVGYTGAAFPEVAANSPYYTSFTINPALPEGLTLNSNTGGIRGVYNQPFEGTFTVSAVNHLGESKQTTITVKIEKCMGEMVQFSLVFYLESGAEKLSFDLKDLTSGEVVETRPRLVSYSTFTIPMCRVAQKYGLVLKKTDTTGWGANRVSVILSDGTTLLTESLAAGVTSKEYDFNVKYEIQPLFSEWSYLVSGEAAPQNWNTVAGAPAWEKAAPGSFPVPQGVTAYYYKKFTVSSLEEFSGVEISSVSRAGLVVYLNGAELSRLNMPDYFDHTTLATRDEDVPSTHIVGDIVLDGRIKEGENIVAFELHQYLKKDKVNTFDGSVLLILNNMYMMKDGAGTTQPIAEGDMGSDKAFDNNSDSKFVTSEKCIGVELTWTFNNQRREPINNYALVSAGDCNTRHPSGWILEGSNDASHWWQLHVAENVVFSEYYQQKRFDFFNDRAFNMYRVTTTACDNEALEASSSCGSDYFQIADYYLFSKRVEPDCKRDGDFPPAMNGDASYADCPQFYEGYRTRLCQDGSLGEETSFCVPMKPQGISFEQTGYTLYTGKPASITPKLLAVEVTISVFPTLPTGLAIDEATGEIKGTPTVEQESKKYTITAMNKGGSVTTTVALTIVKAPVNWLLIGILIAVAVIIIVAIVIVIVVAVNKKKGAMTPKKGSKKGSKAMPKANSANKPKAVVKV